MTFIYPERVAPNPVYGMFILAKLTSTLVHRVVFSSLVVSAALMPTDAWKRIKLSMCDDIMSHFFDVGGPNNYSAVRVS